jgi:hypothetical protein
MQSLSKGSGQFYKGMYYAESSLLLRSTLMMGENSLGREEVPIGLITRKSRLPLCHIDNTLHSSSMPSSSIEIV